MQYDRLSFTQGKSSADIQGLLGYGGSEEVVHRSNISLTALRNPAGGDSSQALAPAEPSRDLARENGAEGAGPSSQGRCAPCPGGDLGGWAFHFVQVR